MMYMHMLDVCVCAGQQIKIYTSSHTPKTPGPQTRTNTTRCMKTVFYRRVIHSLQSDRPPARTPPNP